MVISRYCLSAAQVRIRAVADGRGRETSNHSEIAQHSVWVTIQTPARLTSVRRDPDANGPSLYVVVWITYTNAESARITGVDSDAL